MSVRTDVINLNINVQGDAAKNQLNELRKKAADVKTEIDHLKKGTQEYADKRKELSAINAEMGKLKQTIGLTSLTQKELNQEIKTLTALKNSVTPFTAEWKKYDDQLKKVQDRHYEVKNGVQGLEVYWHKMSQEVKAFGVLAVSYLGFEFLTSQVSNILRGAGKLSDQLADIRRVAGLSAAEVLHLNKQLTAIDTRTSTQGLREIAIIAGKLGVAKEDIAGFTQATDKLVVALGDELGDADQITTQLGKILNVFDGKITGDNITHLGNAIVDLANKGVATGGFIVDFAQRMLGLAGSANISKAAAIGLAAALEETGQRSESASTAVIKVVAAIGKDVNKFAKAAGKDVQEFSQTLKDKPIEALIQMAEGLVKNKNGFQEISQAFNEVGEDGARIVSVLGVIGAKSDFFRKKIGEAGESLKSTSAITDAFNLKNETLGATLDKLGKEFNKTFTNSSVSKFLQSMVQGTLNFLQGLRQLPKFIDEYRVAIGFLIAGILLLNASYIKSAASIAFETTNKIFNAIATKAVAFANNIAIASQAAYITISNLLTGSITRATAAQRLWNTVTSLGAGPIGILLIAIGAAVYALNRMASSLKNVTSEQRIQQGIQEKMTDLITEEEIKAKSLFEALQNKNLQYDTKKRLLGELIAIAPDYLEKLTAENVATQAGADIMNNYISKLRQINEMKARQSLIEDKEKRKAQVLTEIGNLKISPSDLSSAGAVKDGLSLLANQFGIKIDGTDFKKQHDLLTELKDLSTDLDNLYKQSGEDVTKQAEEANKNADAATKNTARTIALIKKQIQDLDKDFEQIDVTNKKALQTNRAARKKLQDELDELEGKNKDNKYTELLKKAEEFAKRLKEIEFKAANATQDKNQAEIDAVRHKYAELLKEYDEYNKKLSPKDRKKLGSRDGINDAMLNELKTVFDKQFKEQAGKEYEEQVKNTAVAYERLKELQSQLFVNGKIDKKQYESEIARIDKDAFTEQIQNAIDYAAVVDKAAADVTKFKKDQLDKQIKDAIAAYEKQLADAKLFSELEKQTKHSAAQTKIGTATKGTKQGIIQQTSGKLGQAENTYNDRVAALEEERTKVIQATTLTEEQRKQAIDDINQQIEDAEADFGQARLDAYQSMTSQLVDMEKSKWDSYIGMAQQANSIINNIQDASLKREERRLEKLKISLNKQLQSKLISQAQYNVQTEKADAELDKKKREVAREQAIRERAVAAFSTIVNTSAAIIKMLADPGGFAGTALSIGAGITGALQLGTILSAPLPELATGNWFKQGDKHNAESGGIPVKIERDEAVMSAAAMTDPNTYSITGTAAQITSALQAKNNATTWASGAIMQPAWQTAKPRQINPLVPSIMANGGFNSISTSTANADAVGINNQLLQQLLEQHKNFTGEISTWQKQLHIVYSASDEKNRRIIATQYDAAKNAAALNQ